MTVLVDEARWEWRGSRWAHLVSDESYDELHELARLLGKRRLGFQGDHYDIDTIDRERAIAIGAVAVDSRQLVRRLVASGLRRGDAKPTWSQLGESPAGLAPSDTIAGLAAVEGSGARRLTEALTHIDAIATDGHAGAWGDNSRLVVLIDLGADIVPPRRGPWVDLVDEVVISEPRVDGDRSVELFAAR